jgi:hypothetical protein
MSGLRYDVVFRALNHRVVLSVFHNISEMLATRQWPTHFGSKPANDKHTMLHSIGVLIDCGLTWWPRRRALLVLRIHRAPEDHGPSNLTFLVCSTNRDTHIHEHELHITSYVLLNLAHIIRPCSTHRLRVSDSSLLICNDRRSIINCRFCLAFHSNA